MYPDPQHEAFASIQFHILEMFCTSRTIDKHSTIGLSVSEKNRKKNTQKDWNNVNMRSLTGNNYFQGIHMEETFPSIFHISKVNTQKGERKR